MIGIRRAEKTVTRCARWVVKLTRCGKEFRKDFYDGTSGGKDIALKMAQAWRDRIVEEHAPMPLADFCNLLRSNNTSGITGVYFLKNCRRTKSGRTTCSPAWCARIPLGKKNARLVQFSVNVYGDERARQLAIAAREKGLAALEGEIFHDFAQPKLVSTPQDSATLDALLQTLRIKRKKIAVESDVKKQKREEREKRAADKLTQAQAAQLALLQITNASGEPYIVRCPSRRLDGIGGFWRVAIRRQGKVHCKTFSDTTNGGEANALMLAKAWRDKTFHALPVISRAQAINQRTARTVSGVIGVYPKYGKGEDRPIIEWHAYRPERHGEPKRIKIFTVAKYGAQEALALAIEAHKTFVAELTDVPHFVKHAAKQMLYAVQQEKEKRDAGYATRSKRNPANKIKTAI